MSPRAASAAMTRPISLMIDGWMPSVGSSRMRSRGRATSARAIASCCCCPPDRSPPRRPSMSFSTGNSVVDLVGDAALRARQGGEAGFQVFRTVSRGKISRPCGTSASPARAR